MAGCHDLFPSDPAALRPAGWRIGRAGGCEGVVTTNFYVLYEKAAAQPDSDDVSMMTWQPMDRRQPWVLKMHGDVDHRE